jgi:hypothetical protein
MAQIKLNATYGMTGTLPAVSGANLTSLTSGNLTGALPAISGASLTTLNASNVSSGTLNAARYSGGKLGQLIQNVITSGSVTHTTTSWVATPQLVVITPSATSSNIYLTFSFQQGSSTANRFALWKIYRDIGGAGFAALTNGVDGNPHEQGGHYASIAGHFTNETSLHFYDDPSTTSECTYKVYMAMQDTTGSVYCYAAADIYGYATAMEILA